MRFCRFLNFMIIVIQKDDHTDLPQWLAGKFIVFVVEIGVLMAVVALFLFWGAIIASDYDLFLVNTHRFITWFTLAKLVEERF